MHFYNHIIITLRTCVLQLMFLNINFPLLDLHVVICSGYDYRLPKELLPEFHTFMDEFAETLETLQVNRNAIYLCGDFNIDLLKINTKIHYNTFYNNLIAQGISHALVCQLV